MNSQNIAGIGQAIYLPMNKLSSKCSVRAKVKMLSVKNTGTFWFYTFELINKMFNKHFQMLIKESPASSCCSYPCCPMHCVQPCWMCIYMFYFKSYLLLYYNNCPMSSSLFSSFQENTKCESRFFADTCTRRVPIFWEKQ